MDETHAEASPGLPRPRLGRYLLIEEIGRGGMGKVFSAYDPELDRKLAIKLLHERKGPAAERAQRRLVREAQALARLSHPNVVSIHDVGETQGCLFLVMDFVAGQTLRRFVEDTPRSWREVVAVYAAAGRGLAAAHAAGLVHRDFKPDNVIVGDDGRVQVLDFGIARAAVGDEEGAGEDELEATESEAQERRGEHGELGEAPADASAGGESPTTEGSLLSSDLTLAGARVGTLAYMAPEVHRRKPADARSDQFSFAVALYEALHAERPFPGQTAQALALAVTSGKLREAPADRRVPKWLRKILVRALATDPADRWPDMNALVSELERDRRRTRRSIAATLAVVAALGGLALVSFATKEPPPPDPCAELGEQMQALWKLEAEARVRQGLARVDRDYARESSERVIAGLERYAAEWTAARRDACRDTYERLEHSTELLDRRVVCLDQRRARLAAVIEVLAQADDATVERAVDLVDALPPLADCEDLDALTLAVAPPPAALAPDVAELRRRMAHVLVSGEAGRAEQALREAEALVEEAAAIDYLPVRAEAHHHLAAAQLRLAHQEQSIASYRRAAWLARAAADLEAELAAEVELVNALAVAGHFDRSDEMVRWAESLLERADPGRAHEARLRYLEGRSLADRGEYTRARERNEQAVEIYAERGEQPELAAALNGLGATLKSLGAHDEALAQVSRAREIMESVYGPDHPRVASTLHTLGRIQRARGHYEEAVAAYGRGIDILERAFGPDAAALGSYYNNLGNVYSNMGREDEAERALTRSLEIREASHGPEHMRTSFPLINLAELFADRGELERARPLAERALAIRERVHGPEGAPMIPALTTLGQIELDRGELRRATELLERALAIHEARAAEDPTLERPAETLLWLGLTLARRTPSSARARELIEEAAELLRADPTGREGELARAQAWLSG